MCKGRGGVIAVRAVKAANQDWIVRHHALKFTRWVHTIIDEHLFDIHSDRMPQQKNSRSSVS